MPMPTPDVMKRPGNVFVANPERISLPPRKAIPRRPIEKQGSAEKKGLEGARAEGRRSAEVAQLTGVPCAERSDDAGIDEGKEGDEEDSQRSHEGQRSGTRETFFNESGLQDAPGISGTCSQSGQ